MALLSSTPAPTESSSIFARVTFSDLIFEGSFGGLLVSKWVMQYIVGNLSTSTFQRYKFCADRSLDERVMAPGSWGAGAIFVCFSGEDSGRMGDATSEPRVARRSRYHHLSNTPGLAGQLAASRKDSACEGGCPEEKCIESSAYFSLLFVCVCARI